MVIWVSREPSGPQLFCPWKKNAHLTNPTITCLNVKCHITILSSHAKQFKNVSVKTMPEFYLHGVIAKTNLNTKLGRP